MVEKISKGEFYSDLTRCNYTQELFLRMAQKRLRKHLRKTKELNPKNTYVITSSQISSALILKRLLDEIFKKSPAQVLIQSSNSSDLQPHPDSYQRIIASPLEEHVSLQLTSLFTKQSEQKLLSSLQPSVNPLRLFSYAECLELKKIFDIKEPFINHSHELLERVHTKYPQTKSSILKSFDSLSSRLKH
ncbi:MAG: hypothetical protein ACQESC_01065 [Nanobdellota archaeon]